MRARFPFLFLTLGALAGCTSSAQVVQSYETRCEARGLEPGSQAFKECVARFDTERSVRMESRRMEMLDKTTAPPLLGGR